VQEGWAVKGVSHDGAPKQQHQYTTEQREFLTEKYDNAGGHKLLLADVHEDTKRKFCEKGEDSPFSKRPIIPVAKIKPWF